MQTFPSKSENGRIKFGNKKMLQDTESLINISHSGPVAQRLEQWTHNPLVRGSNPRGPIILCRPKIPFSDERLKMKRETVARKDKTGSFIIFLRNISYNC